jgi:hypothetical protein
MKTIQEIFDEYGVDTSRLKRNYAINPLKIIPRNDHGGIRKELPYKEDVQYLYIELNMLREDASIVFDRSESGLMKAFKKLGIRKDTKKIKENLKKNLLKNEGITNVFQREGVKEKSKNTLREKYGTEYYSQTTDFLEKVKNTKFKKYGNENYNNTKKNQDTCLKRYGSKIYMCKDYSEEQRDLLEHEDKLLQYIIDNKVLNIKDLSTKLNIRYRTMWLIINKNNWYYLFDYSKSIPEKCIRDYINQYYETENNTRKYLKSREIDIYIPELKIGVEFNGNFYHNEYAKPKNYHQEKSLLAEEKGIFIYHIFEYEWNTNRLKILHELNHLLKIDEETIDENDLTVKVFDGNDVVVNAYKNDELTAFMKFCKSAVYEYELAEYWVKDGYNLSSGEILFKAFIESYKPKTIISYSSIGKEKDEVYTQLGFELNGLEEPDYIWFKSGMVVKRSDDEDVDKMIKEGYYKIYNCGRKIWVWKA